MPVRRGGNTEGAAPGNRFAQQIEECILDTRIFDARRSEQKFYDDSPYRRIFSIVLPLASSSISLSK